MWAMASSIDSTTATARILSRYSVSQSDGSAAFMAGTISRAAGSPRSSTPSRIKARAALGRKVGATDRCTRSVSAALQTPGRCTLALTMILTAMSRSHRAST